MGNYDGCRRSDIRRRAIALDTITACSDENSALNPGALPIKRRQRNR